MAEVVAGLLVSALVGIAKDKLGSAIGGQASLLCNFGDDLEEMKDHLDTISAVLVDAERQSVKKERVRLWLKRLRDAALDISDMLEEYQDTSDQAKAKIAVLSCLPVAYKKIAVANRMKSLREKLRKIVKEIAEFNFELGSSTNNEQPYDQRETMSYLPEEPVVGRALEKQEIINLLSADTSTNAEIVIVAIWGLGGMGKSTLAQLVYNDDQFKQYDHRLWVYVSQDFNLIKIGNSMISQVLRQESQNNMGTQQAVKQQLDELLHAKTVLVVLDDLWEENSTELEKLRTILHVKGSKVDVIVTTRKEDIAREVSTTERSYKLQSLEDAKCWEIIKRSSNFELKPDHEKIEQVGLDIAKKCGGVALAARAVGFLLRSKNDLSGWTEINNSGIWNGSSDDCDVLPSLKLSYEKMTPQLRICFSYCAIFPKGHNIVEDYLIQQWTALDFIEQSKGKECINKLLEMSFLQVSKMPSTSQEHVVRYTMHDLVHDLATLTVADELIVFDDVAPQRNTHDHKYCHYSLLRKYDRTILAKMPSKLRALRFSVSGELDIPSGAFLFAKWLRTLDFSECSGIMFPASIGRMKQLRCLIASRIQNDSLPECIVELSKLQYLNINGSSKITELPRSIGKLECLKYLCLSGCSSVPKLPESFGDLKCMVHLDMLGCSCLIELPDSIGNLTHLQHLDLSGCSGLKGVPESLCGLTQLQYLNLSSCAYLEGLPAGIGNLVGIQHLNMSGCEQIRQLPDSFGGLKCMVHLDMSGYSRLIELPDSIGNLTNLQHLELSGCSILKALPESLCDLTRLQYLNISSCSCLEGLPVGFGSLVGIKFLNMSGCEQFRELPDSFGGLKCMVHLDMSGCSGLIELPDSIGNQINLQHLELSGCSIIKELPESLCRLTQLQYLNLSSCFCLEGLPVGIGRLVGIKSLNMSCCKRITQLPESVIKLQSLSHLDLSACWRMRSGSLTCLRGLTALQHLDITSQQYHDLSVDLGGSSNNLRYLKLSNCKLVCCDFIGTLTNLEHLDLSWNFNLVCLPESICNLKRLHTLDLSYCPLLNSLPDSIGTLGLKSLLLEGCSKRVIDQASSIVNYLQALPIFKVRVDEVNGCSNLHLLEGINVSELRIFSLENVRSLEEATKVKLSDKHNLVKLRLEWSHAARFLDDQYLLGQLVPPRSLRSMLLEGYSCTSFPSWVMCIYSYLPNLVSIQLHCMPTCSNLPPLGQLPHLENLSLQKLPAIKRIDREFCGGNGAFRRLSHFCITDMNGFEEWNTTYFVEDGVEEFMFPVLDSLEIRRCPRLRLKPCLPTFRECIIWSSDQVISSIEEVDKTSHQCSSSRAIKLRISWHSRGSIRLFHHFPALQQLRIQANLKSLPESMRHLTSLESLTLEWCNGISALPEWLDDLSSLKSLVIEECRGIKSLPPCIQQLTKLQKLEIRSNQELTEWCESEENKPKLAHINFIEHT